MESSYSETEYALDVKYFATSTTGHTLLPEIFEISDLKKMVKFYFPMM